MGVAMEFYEAKLQTRINKHILTAEIRDGKLSTLEYIKCYNTGSIAAFTDETPSLFVVFLVLLEYSIKKHKKCNNDFFAYLMDKMCDQKG